MSSLLSAEISATCNALGYFDEKTNKYYADTNTLETVKDLIRYLRRDDDIHTIRRQLGDTNVLTTDLLPLLKSYHEESDLFDVLLRLIMNLTTPPLLLFNFEIPTDSVLRNHYLDLEDHLKSYKEAFVDEGVWAVFSTHLSKILDVDYTDRGDENGVKIERVLVLIRNIMFVPADMMEKRPDNDASIHDQVLWALHHSGLLDIILYITTNPAEQGYYMYILEIMFFMLKGQKPSELASAALQRSQGEKIRDEAELVNIRHTEQNIKQNKAKKYMGSRHSRFGGTFVVKSMKSITDNDLISHRPLNKLDSLNFDTNKRQKKVPRNRAPLVDNKIERRSAFTIRLFLKEFCIEYLNGAYNNMMQYVKGVLVRSGGENHDESYYLWALSFFMSFNRYYKFEVKLVSETLSVQTFHYVQQQSENYLDLMKTDKKKLLIWSTRLHTALLSYKELLSTLFVMDKSSDKVVNESSKVIKSNIFYLPEYREFIVTLLIMYDELKMTDLYLRDLMETQHLFLKMFEMYCKSEGSIVVKQKTKGKKKKRTKNTSSNGPTELNLDEMWDKVSPELSAIIESGGEFLTDAPFDATLDIPIDDQKGMAMKKIQNKLRHSEYESAIGLMRAAREVWPENNSFGNDNMTIEEEFLALRDVFYADLGDNHVENTSYADSYDEEEEDEEESEESSRPREKEVNFNFNDFLCRLLHPKIVRAAAYALKSFETNSVNTNHAILKLMHRIAFDCKCYVMMFQLSLFRTFQKIFSLKNLPQYKELVKFAIYILREFFKTTQTNDKVFVEVLFWKHKKDAYEIEHGYGTTEKSSAALGKMWTEEEENELRVLFKEHQDKQIEEDVVDWILSNLVNQTRSRRMVLKKLKELDILENYSKQGKSRRNNSPYWTAEEETQLRELYSQFKDSPDVLKYIISGLSYPRPKNKIIDKMLTLGLIQDKNDLKKKSKTKSNKNEVPDDFLSSDSDSSSTSTRVPVKSKSKSTSKKRRPHTITAGKEEIIKLLKENISAGRESAVTWLKESIFDVIDDFEEGHEGIPLVPLDEDVESALETEDFQKLLRSFGFSAPFDEQESYWRIPSHIKLNTLKDHYELITTGLDNNLPDDNTQNQNDSSQESPSRTGRRTRIISSSDDDSEAEKDVPITDNNKSNSNINSNSDESEDEMPKQHNASRPKVVSDSEDSDTERLIINENSLDDGDNVTEMTKRSRTNSESDSPPVKRSKTED
ncbi:unnamed protein product [Diabrotica balteata]|uniref:Timeless N-terminal domain-containing protein n=1 Tax=Diabrotica balteata TaxID=107213 RepID=A0A9N9TBT2_DIABA|nr:unnamed protein product [Diabrotica balteata]